MDEDRNQAMLESYRSGGTDKVRWSYEPCAREHEPGRACILPNEHEMHPLLEELRKDETVKDNSTARHLQLCPSAHHLEGTARGITCNHDFWWNLTMAEQYYLNNKI